MDPGGDADRMPVSLVEGEPVVAQVAALGAALGRPLRYEPLADEEARAAIAADTPASYVDAFFRFYSDGEFDDAGMVDTVERLAGRPPRRFTQWARAHADAFR